VEDVAQCMPCPPLVLCSVGWCGHCWRRADAGWQKGVVAGENNFLFCERFTNIVVIRFLSVYTYSDEL
jgi:hypothetical protein